MSAEIDLAAYMARIGHAGPVAADLETLTALQLEHQQAIAFEALDPLLGRRVKLDADSLQAKLVHGGRGGYCFEQNGLFLRVLRAIGFQVTPLAARVRWGRPEDYPPTPLSHMLLKVDLAEGPFIVDVGFGGPGPVAPLRLQAGLEQPTGLGRYRLDAAAGGFELKFRLEERWAVMYRFTDEAQSPADYEMFNWYASAYPGSGFLGNLLASRVVGSGRLNLWNLELTTHGPGGSVQTLVQGPAELHRLLSQDFGIAIGLEEVDSFHDRLPRPEKPAGAG